MKRILPALAFLAQQASLLASAGSGPWTAGAYYAGQTDGRYSANVYNDASVPGGVVRTNSYTTTSGSLTNVIVTTTTNSTFTNVPAPPSGTTIVTTNSTSSVTPVQFTNVTSPAAANVVSGILGFGIRNGTPAVGGATNTAATAAGTAGGFQSGNASVASIGLDPTLNYFLIYVNGDVYVGQTAAQINMQASKVNGTLVNGAGRTTYQLFTNQESAFFGVANVGVDVVSLPTASASGYFDAKIKNNKSPFTFKGDGEIAIRDAAGTVQSDRVYPFKVDGIKASENSISASGQTGRNAP